MAESIAFINRILDDPENNVARLIYADWLDEKGDPQGEFIRAQICLLTCAHDDPRRMDLERREKALREVHSAELKQSHSNAVVSYQRGFVSFQVNGYNPLEELKSFDRVPWWLDVVIRDHGVPDQGNVCALSEKEAFSVAACPLLDRVTEITWMGRWPWGGQASGDLIARTICQSPYARHLRRLQLDAITDEGARQLCESPHLMRLETIRVDRRLHRGVSDVWWNRLQTRFSTTSSTENARTEGQRAAKPTMPD